MSKSFRPYIGKNAIENLTSGIYEDARFIFREYIQNSADSIDFAVSTKLYKKQSSKIQISIEPQLRRIIIQDNATGIETKKVQSLLGNIAFSTKDRYTDKGFRGIGRLGGLGYCEKLTYETSFEGENIKSIMVWDAKKLKEIINNPQIKIDASQVISAITKFSRIDGQHNSHYFKVILDNVTDEKLLDEDNVRDYLSMVAPVPFSESFTFKNSIYNEAKAANVKIDEYKILLNEKQLFKSYKDEIKKKNGSTFDKIFDTVFFSEKYGDELLYWGWHAITYKMQQIPDGNNEKYIRLRKNNIQLGSDQRINKFFKKPTGAKYFVGEIYAVNKNLIPNSSRDFFIDNEFSKAFERSVSNFFDSNLTTLFYDFSDKNSALKIIALFNEKQKQLNEQSTQKERDVILNDLKALSDEVSNAKKTLVTLYDTYSGRALSKIIEENQAIDELKKETGYQGSSDPALNLPENELNFSEKKLLAFILDVIKTSSKSTPAQLIREIKKQIAENYRG
jgi:hypothetical protein